MTTTSPQRRPNHAHFSLFIQLRWQSAAINVKTDLELPNELRQPPQSKKTFPLHVDKSTLMANYCRYIFWTWYFMTMLSDFSQSTWLSFYWHNPDQHHNLTIELETTHFMDLDDIFDKLNRVAVVAVQEEKNQLSALRRQRILLGRWKQLQWRRQLITGISDGVIACCFDTTNSNTGISFRGCVLLQQLLNKQLWWLACRHYIPELLLKAAFQSLFGNTKGPVEVLCSTIKSSWKSLDLFNICYPQTPACYRSTVDSLLQFLNDRLHPDILHHLTRGDYKEFLELVKCVLVVLLLQHQINSLDSETKKKIKTMTSFILYVYIKYWLRSPSISTAANDDLQMFRDLKTFKKIDKIRRQSLLFSLLKIDNTFLLEDNWRDTMSYATLLTYILPTTQQR